MYNPFSISSQYVNLSTYQTLHLADAAAVAGGFGLNIDTLYTLTEDTTLSSKSVVFSGGMITLGNHNLVFGTDAQGCAVQALPVQIFNYSGTGIVTGTIRSEQLCVEWWGAYDNGTNGTATRKAFQYAGNFAIQNHPNGRQVLCKGQNYQFDNTGLTFTSAAEMPLFVGSGITPDATNISFTPASPATAFTFVGTAAGVEAGGGFDGIFFSCNSNGSGITLNNSGFNKIRIGWAGSGATPVTLLNTNTNFTESNSITIVGGLAASASAIVMAVSGGTNSFAGTRIEPETNLTLVGNRSGVPVVSIGSGAFWYNGNINGIYLIAGATGSYLIKKTGSTPPCFISGAVKFEANDSNPLGFCDPTGGGVYFGGSLTVQGTNNTDISNVTYFRQMSYGTGGVIDTFGAGLYGQTLTQAGNTTFNFGGGGVGQAYRTFYINVVNSDNSYVWYGQIQMTTNGSTGHTDITSQTLSTDTHSYGSPTFAVSGGGMTMSNSNWPSGSPGPFTASYSTVAP